MTATPAAAELRRLVEQAFSRGWTLGEVTLRYRVDYTYARAVLHGMHVTATQRRRAVLDHTPVTKTG